ncbi:fimbrial protein [Citrobacter sedlakii]|nr:fimbrial protein [Citrobacter sedlakii]
MRIFSLFYLIVACLIFGLSPVHACTNTYSAASIVLDPVVVQRDTPVGTVIQTKSADPGPGYYQTDPGGCKDATTMLFNGGIATAVEHTYETGVEGIGIRALYHNTHGDFYAENPTYRIWITWWGGAYNAINSIEVSLVVTGKVSSGSISPGQLSSFQYDGDGGIPSALSYLSLASPVQVTKLACALTTPNTLSFPIGDVLASQFTAEGTLSQETATANLNLICDEDANINITLDGVQNADSTDTSVLALSGQGDNGVAEDIGVQLLNDGTPLKLNERLTLKKSAGGQESFPFTARYIQTKDKVHAGTANATATLNITYQ